MQRDSIPILVSRNVKTRKFKLLYFRNETCYGTGDLYKEFVVVVYLQPSINKNLKNHAILTLQFDDVTVKTIHCQSLRKKTGLSGRRLGVVGKGGGGCKWFG